MKSKNIIIIYGFLVSLVLTLVGVLSAKTTEQLISSLLFLPLIFYFGTGIIKLLRPTVIIPKKRIIKSRSTIITPVSIDTTNSKEVTDHDKRLFLRLIASTGFSLFLMSLFTKKAQAAFFGSVPGPGTIAIKNTSGQKIDPAEAHPTDGYEITEIDDSTSPAYYGFLKKNGAWYITKEDSSGAYRYVKGSTSFSTNWTNRASLTYGYFDTVFG